MKFTPTAIAGAWILELDKRVDARGFFARTFCEQEFRAHGIAFTVRQCNVSHNRQRGTLRGMHYQAAPHAEGKVVWCYQGAIYDVALDLRPGSATCGRHVGVDLTADNGRLLYLAPGLAHGFLTRADETGVFYWMDAFYQPDAGRGVRYDDPAFQIAWPEPVRALSPRDAAYPAYAPDA